MWQIGGFVVYYKYGCSDQKFNNLGGTPFLLWKTIAEAKSKGATEFDLGRSERRACDIQEQLGPES